MIERRTGRPRRYPRTPLEGFVSPRIAELATDLAELHERAYDQVVDLAPSELNAPAPGTSLTIGWLLMHMVAADAGWIARLTGEELPAWLHADANYAALTPYETSPATFTSAADIIELARRSFSDHTLPVLRRVSGPDAPAATGALPTAGQVLRHLVWHWSFHSGHIGLIRLQLGGEYDWGFADDPG
jgi:uncharacterized damage-inducible protein DinB